uniref:S-methyl-5'-thioadenosine phosphorylase n=1 Tax=Panagrolaimus sp. PS1159 TaxID=55785 RepID=A0AC35G0S9_9BILA
MATIFEGFEKSTAEITEPKIKIGIIGGTGLENSEFMLTQESVSVMTPYGEPSDTFTLGSIDGVEIVALARHGRKHEINPTNVNFRANLWAMKSLGVNMILASNASGSLREELPPGCLVIPTSFIDHTNQRPKTFYDGAPGHPTGVCHIPCYPAYSEGLRSILHKCAKDINVPAYDGNIICIEGPRFSSRAESMMYRQWGADVINMTACPEVYLARELGILYAAVALVTDYDCWRVEDTEFVTVEQVKQVMIKNAINTTKLFANAVTEIKKNSKELLKEAALSETIARAAVMC